MTRYKPCPECSSIEVKKVSFTWWGGMLGPSLLSHVKCQDCGIAYNGKTGESNTTAIIVYSVVMFVIAIGVLILLAKM